MFLLFVPQHSAIDLLAEDKTDWWDIDWCKKYLHWIEIETF